jgi:hypothetical protein
VNFADYKDYELKLPLLQKDQWDGDIEGELEFLLQFSVCFFDISFFSWTVLTFYS